MILQRPNETCASQHRPGYGILVIFVRIRKLTCIGRSRIGTIGPWAALACIYLAIMTVTELITNKAASLLMFLLGLETAKIFQVDARPYVIALTLAASASFITPIDRRYGAMSNWGWRFQISNLKSQISNLKSQISNLKSQISDFKFQISNLKSQISDSIPSCERPGLTPCACTIPNRARRTA